MRISDMMNLLLPKRESGRPIINNISASASMSEVPLGEAVEGGRS